MPRRTETLRKEIQDSGSTLAEHSLNSRFLKVIIDGERSIFPTSKKKEKSKEIDLRVPSEILFEIERGKEYHQTGLLLTPEYKRFLRRHGVNLDRR